MDNQLFSGSDPFYKIEPVINRYIKDPNIISMLNLGIYLSGINNVVVNVETSSSNGIISIPVSSLTSSNSGNISTAFYTEIGSGVIFNNGPLTSILNQIVVGMPNLNNDSITKSHKSFDEKMRQIFETFSYKALLGAINNLSVPLNTATDSNVFSNINLAVEELKNMPNSKLLTLINIIADLAKDTLINMITSDDSFNEAASNDFTLSALNNNNNETSPTYLLLGTNKFFLLRQTLYNNLVIPSNILGESDGNVKLYVQKLLSDLYIKCCCPLVQYDIISAFSAKFQKTGDFVNLRFSLLAKITYLRNFIINFVSIYNSAQNDDTNIINTQNTNTIITRILNLLNSYLQQVNNIDINSNQDQLRNIMKKLHLLSDDIVEKSQRIQNVKSQVDNGQLTLRNMNINYDIISKKYKNSYYKWNFLVLLLLLYIIISGVILYIGKTGVIYIFSAIVILTIIIFEFFRFIVKLVL